MQRSGVNYSHRPISEEAIEILIKEKRDILREIEAMRVVMNDKQERLKELNLLVNELDGSKIDWTQKAINAFNFLQRPMTTSEILESAFQLNKTALEDPKNRRKYIQQLSLVLFRLCNKGYIFSEEIKGCRGKYYGLAQWKSDSGSFKPEYSYFFKELSRRKGTKTAHDFVVL